MTFFSSNSFWSSSAVQQLRVLWMGPLPIPQIFCYLSLHTWQVRLGRYAKKSDSSVSSSWLSTINTQSLMESVANIGEAGASLDSNQECVADSLTCYAQEDLCRPILQCPRAFKSHYLPFPSNRAERYSFTAASQNFRTLGTGLLLNESRSIKDSANWKIERGRQGKPHSRVVLPHDLKKQEPKDTPSDGDVPVTYITVKGILRCATL